MGKFDPRFLFTIEVTDIEFLTAYKALDLVASILLRDGRSVKSILEVPEPTRFVDMDEVAALRYLEARESDDFIRRVFDDPIEYAEKFPRLATLDRLKDVLSQLLFEQKIALHFSINLLPVQPTTQLDDDAFLTTILFFEDFVAFANAVGIAIEFPKSEEKSVQDLVVQLQLQNKDNKNGDWITIARELAEKFIKVQAGNDLYPSQIHIAEHVAQQMRAERVFGAEGKPLSGAYIKRHALKGISSAVSKQTSTTIKRSKQGN